MDSSIDRDLDSAMDKDSGRSSDMDMDSGMGMNSGMVRDLTDGITTSSSNPGGSARTSSLP